VKLATLALDFGGTIARNDSPIRGAQSHLRRLVHRAGHRIPEGPRQAAAAVLVNDLRREGIAQGAHDPPAVATQVTSMVCVTMAIMP
jgi:hypothetical protein